MKTENKLSFLFLAGIAMALMLSVKFIPSKEQQEEKYFQQRIDDTTQTMHSEIKVQELSESEMYYREIEIEERNR